MEKSPKVNFRSIAGNAIIFLLLIFVTFWLIFKDRDLGQIFRTLGTVNIWFILIGVCFMLGYFLIEAWNIKSLLHSLGEDISLRKAYKFTLIGFFFCSVTPGASGGQPIEIYYMSKEKIPGPKATMAILIQTCGIQMAVMLLGIFFLIFNPPIAIEGVVLSLFSIGLIINGTALVVLLVCIFSNYLAKKVVNFFFFLFEKLHLKKLAAKKASVDAALSQYAESSAYIKSHRKEFFAAMGRSILQMCLYYLIPFWIYKAFGLSEYNAWQLFALQSILFIATSGLPIPGAIGASESVFLSIYGLIFGTELISGAMLLNRGINFYLFVIISMIAVIINIIRLKHRPVNFKFTKKSNDTKKAEPDNSKNH